MKKYSCLLLGFALTLPLYAEEISMRTAVESRMDEKRQVTVDRRALKSTMDGTRKVAIDRRDALSQGRNTSIDRRNHLAEERYNECVICMEAKRQKEYDKLELKLKH